MCIGVEHKAPKYNTISRFVVIVFSIQVISVKHLSRILLLLSKHFTACVGTEPFAVSKNDGDDIKVFRYSFLGPYLTF